MCYLFKRSLCFDFLSEEVAETGMKYTIGRRAHRLASSNRRADNRILFYVGLQGKVMYDTPAKHKR